MRSETITALIILSAVVLIFGIVGWIVVRLDAKLGPRYAGIVSDSNSGGGTNGLVSVSCGDGGAGCGS